MDRSSSLKIFQAIKGMHRRNRTVISAYGLEVDMLSSAVLGEVFAGKVVSLNHIKSKFKLSSVQANRIQAKLLKLQIISTSLDLKDRRKKVFSLTKSGNRLYLKILERANITFSPALNRLNKSEQIRFKELFELFLLNLEVEPSVAFKQDPALMTQIRQLTKRLGLLGNNLFGIRGLDPIKWHILSFIQDATPTKQTISTLSKSFGIPLTSTLVIVLNLTKSNYLRRKSNGVKKEIEITASGISYLQTVQEKALALLNSGLSKMNILSRKEFADLWIKYSGNEIYFNERTIGETLTIARITSSPQRFDFRAFIFEERYKQGLTKLLPKKIGDTSSELLCIRAFNKIIVAAEFSKLGKNWEIIHLVSTIEPPNLKKHLRILFEDFFTSSGAKRLVLDKNNCSASLWGLVEGRAKSSRYKTLTVNTFRS